MREIICLLTLVSAAPVYHQKNFRDDVRLQEHLDFDALDLPRLHAAILLVTNETRQEHGVGMVQHQPKLEIAARRHAERMVAKDFFAHQDPYDSALRTPEQRARAAGITNPRVSENIATTFGLQYRAGQSFAVIDASRGLFSFDHGGPPIPAHTHLTLADALVTQWMNSPGHRRNLLEPKAKEVGCGVGFYREKGFPRFKAVQMFQVYEVVAK